MADARHFCPDCGSIDLQITRQFVLVSKEEDTGATAKCPNCGWEGPLSKTIGAVTSEEFWDIERVGDVLLRVVSRHAAGPFVQVMEFVGLLPRKKELRELADELGYPKDFPDLGGEGDLREKLAKYNTMVDQMREIVLKEMLAASISAGFEAAEKVHREFAAKTKTRPHPMFLEDHQGERGNVTPLRGGKKGRRRGR
jgi:predicted RNA-binding Zn-ribbon protein involved in translation (DUF1610 family)